MVSRHAELATVNFTRRAPRSLRARMSEEVLSMSTIGLIGADHIGSQVARLAIASGHDVVLSNSRGPETLSPLIAELGSRARAAVPADAATAGDIVVVT